VQFALLFRELAESSAFAFTHVILPRVLKFSGDRRKSSYAKMVIEGAALKVLGLNLFSEKKTFYENLKKQKETAASK
jgi:hypothetical protein